MFLEVQHGFGECFLYACGRAFQLAQDHHAAYVFDFKPGRLPALWVDFQALLTLCPERRVERETPAGVRQGYRWVNDLSYEDSAGRSWRLTALQCEEHHPDGTRTRWAREVHSTPNGSNRILFLKAAPL